MANLTGNPKQQTAVCWTYIAFVYVPTQIS